MTAPSTYGVLISGREPVCFMQAGFSRSRPSHPTRRDNVAARSSARHESSRCSSGGRLLPARRHGASSASGVSALGGRPTPVLVSFCSTCASRSCPPRSLGRHWRRIAHPFLSSRPLRSLVYPSRPLGGAQTAALRGDGLRRRCAGHLCCTRSPASSPSPASSSLARTQRRFDSAPGPSHGGRAAVIPGASLPPRLARPLHLWLGFSARIGVSGMVDGFAHSSQQHRLVLAAVLVARGPAAVDGARTESELGP